MLAKHKLSDLACLGGQPLFEQALHVGAPIIKHKESLLTRISQVLDSGILTNGGPQVKAFEQALSEWHNVKHCIAVANGTLALMVTLKALCVKGEVIVPSFTFPATVHALIWCGLTPVFAEIDSQTHLLDPQDVSQHITSQTIAILGVHLWGNICDVDKLQALANRFQLKLIFDAAHALGSAFQQRKVGGFGDAEIVSFHATKFIQSVEGGAILTNSDTLARRVRQLINFGYEAGHIQSIGINAKMHEISAAVGLHNLEQHAEIANHNQVCYQEYKKAIAQIKGLHLYEASAQVQSNHQYIIVEIGPEFGLSRDQVYQILTAERTLARRYFYPAVHQSIPFEGARVSLPITESISQQIIALPTGPQLTIHQIQKIAQLLAFIKTHQEDLKDKLPLRI